MNKLLSTFFLSIIFFSVNAQDIPVTSCENCWDADSLGNHRAVVSVTENTLAAMAILPWHRMDRHPQEKGIIITDSAHQKQVFNILIDAVTADTGKIVFEPVSGKGTYYIYYLPFSNKGSANYPVSVYRKPEYVPAKEWLDKIKNSNAIPAALTKRFESVDSFNTFFPMEIKASDAAVKQLLLANANKNFLVFPENRLHSIRNKFFLPERWLTISRSKFSDTAARGENFAYQLGVYAIHDLKNVAIQFSDLKGASGSISKSKMFCINSSGISYDAKPFKKTINIPAGNIQPLWCGINVPASAAPGIYKGVVTVTSTGNAAKRIAIELRVTSNIVNEGNTIQPWKMTRLPWLNSTLAQKNTVIAPYTPLEVKGREVSLLGRKLVIGLTGLPEKILSYFDETMISYSDKPENILGRSMRFKVRNAKGALVEPIRLSFAETSIEAGTVQWRSTSKYNNLKMIVDGYLEFDGYNEYHVKFIAQKDVAVDDIFLEIPMDKAYAKYFMGLGFKGGARPESIDWKWDVAHKNQDGAWIGSVNGGLHFSLRDEHYTRPLNTNFYLLKPLLLPVSWGNNNKGGIKVYENGNTATVQCYSGPRTMKKGDTLYFNFNLLITPFHTLNTDFQWKNRFFHAYKPIDSVKATGASIINIHHATAINPWINYPFIAWPKMKAYIDSAHHAGLKVKIYNTIRELSNHAYETFALRSLGTEIYSPGKGGGYSWLQEHLDSNYIAAWFVPEIKDAAIINSGMNRWHNYYVEGMNWLTQHVGIDGIYLDDVAFDRITMKRIKRVLTKDGHPGIIDLHSANQYNERDGYNNSANLYMEHFPYLNRLWFGEYFDYQNNGPDFFLTEVSGIPFGLMGEMLQGGGNAWRGMVYGMTNRMPWSDNADPRPLWKVWDHFEMEGSKMIGYWVSDPPVTTNNKNILATVYLKKGKALVSIGSWADTDTTVYLNIDWKKLGINSEKANIEAPYVQHFQEQRTFKIDDAIPVEKNKGWLLIISEK